MRRGHPRWLAGFTRYTGAYYSLYTARRGSHATRRRRYWYYGTAMDADAVRMWASLLLGNCDDGTALTFSLRQRERVACDSTADSSTRGG
eukprot:COSAG06_NODE_30479_length_538_cov_0.929385_1_plen_90_part_00